MPPYAAKFAVDLVKATMLVRGLRLQLFANIGTPGRWLSTTPAVSMEMPPCEVKPKQYEGLPYHRVKAIRQSNINPGKFVYYKKPLLIHQGHMQWLWDHEGNRYLDLLAGIVTVSVGHCHPIVNKRLISQLQSVWHTTNIYWHSPIHEYAEKLAAKMPGDLKVVYFTNSGSEANELAMLMSTLYTGSTDFVTMRNAYHGASPSVMGLTALVPWAYPNLPVKMSAHQTMNANPYRGHWGGSHCRDSLAQTQRTCSCAAGVCEASQLYADELSDMLNHSCPKQIAAFFAEAIQGVGGTIQYPKGFLKKAYEVVRERGGLCIADEVQTGFGRLGDKYWGFETHDVMPDMVTMAKGIANGFPMGAVVTTPEIAKMMTKALHFNTFGGNPMACAVASAVVDVIDDEGLQANSKRVGDIFLKGMMELRDEFEIVGDVRGKGLMLGMELVEDKASKTPLKPERMATLFEHTKDKGVLFGKGGLHGTTLRIKPPMCITEEDANFAVHVLREALQQCS